MQLNNKNKFSIVIPTLQKNLQVLDMLIHELAEDNTIGEIIIINNSKNDYFNDSSKVRIFSLNKNLFVNPSWNLGVKQAKYNYIGILNDDLLLPKNLCYQVLQKLLSDNSIGLIGLNSSDIQPTDIKEMTEYPVDSAIKFDTINNSYLTGYWGSAIFGKKNDFYKIPEKMKIWCGDNYLLEKNIKNKKNNYQICNCVIKHLGSLSVNNSEFVLNILKKDICYYAKIDKRYKSHPLYKDRNTFLQNIFSIKNRNKHKVITILGVKIKLQAVI